MLYSLISKQTNGGQMEFCEGCEGEGCNGCEFTGYQEKLDATMREYLHTLSIINA